MSYKLWATAEQLLASDLNNNIPFRFIGSASGGEGNYEVPSGTKTIYIIARIETSRFLQIPVIMIADIVTTLTVKLSSSGSDTTFTWSGSNLNVYSEVTATVSIYYMT